MSMPSTPTSAHPAGGPSPRWPRHESLQLTSLYEAARRLLRPALPAAQPMISRAGVRDEAHRVRSVLRATRDQQLIGGK